MVAVASYLFTWNTTDDGVPLPELEEIARAWTEKNIGGMAGNEMVDFIVSESLTEQPGLLSEYLKERLEPATTWSYGPIVRVEKGRYEVTATASTRVHDMCTPWIRKGPFGDRSFTWPWRRQEDCVNAVSPDSGNRLKERD